MPSGTEPARRDEVADCAAHSGGRYYFISDLHIGGDGALDHCAFEEELVAFLRDLEQQPADTELIILGDAFGLWELTEPTGPAKLDRIAATHGDLFEQLRRTGERIRITLLPGNHDYDLACYPEYVDKLAAYNVHLEQRQHIIRTVNGRRIWIEHGNQHDAANRFPDFGNPYGLPIGYFITADVVGASGREASRPGGAWVGGLHSVYPTEEVPLWAFSNYFYREMSMLLRWVLLPFLLLLTASVLVLIGQALEQAGLLRTSIFQGEPFRQYGVPGRLVDFVLWANGTVITFLLMLLVPLWLLVRDVRAALRRYGLHRPEHLSREKDRHYVEAARAVFADDPSTAVFVYGHTHAVSLREIDGRYVINTGTWLKRLERVRPAIGWLPPIFVPSCRLNYFVIGPAGRDVRLEYHVIPKSIGSELTPVQRMVLLWRGASRRPGIPAEVMIPGGSAGASSS